MSISLSRVPVHPHSVNRDWLPEIALLNALGLFLVALATRQARFEQSGSMQLYWAGILAIFLPAVLRLGYGTPSRRERIGLLVMLGLMLYGVKVLRSPTYFTFIDEMIHFRSATDLARTTELFAHNPILPVSPSYPGLEIVTNTLMDLAGLHIFPAGTIVVGVARVVLMLSLYFLYEDVTGSERIASIACVLYAANPNFVYLDAQFSYESLAAPLLTFVLCLFIWRAGTRGNLFPGLSAFILLASAALVATHHVTSYALLGVGILWILVYRMVKLIKKQEGRLLRRLASIFPARRQVMQSLSEYPAPVLLICIIFVGIVFWTLFIGAVVLGYLAPTLLGALRELVSLILQEQQARTLFQSSGGYRAPPEERLVGLVATALVSLGILFGLVRIWRHHLNNVIMLIFAVMALSFPGLLLFRFTQIGADISNRTWAFSFIGVAPVVAFSIDNLFRKQDIPYLRLLLLVVISLIAIPGMIIIGWNPFERLPGPYMVSAQGRSVDFESIQTAEWAREYLGPANNVVADRMNNIIISSYGEQHTLLSPETDFDFAEVYFSSVFGSTERQIIQEAQVRYLLVDFRLSTALPVRGTYIDYTEPNANRHQTPISAGALQKFDSVPEATRVFDSGNLVIYDLSKLPDVVPD